MTDAGDIIRDVGRYYADKVRAHGATPQGADWNSAHSQELRFRTLMKVAGERVPSSILDYGCGYGALYDHLIRESPASNYIGYDIAAEMLETARTRLPAGPTFVSEIPHDARYDVVVSSGIFNVRLTHGDAVWRDYVLATLARLDHHSTMGFAFNMLTSYSDEAFKKANLYYADPAFFFDVCKRRYSRNVALLHDYDLYEFTILVRK